MLPSVKKSISCGPLLPCVLDCFHLNMVLDLCIFLSWLRLFQWRKQYYGLRTEVTVWISNFIYYKHAIFCFKDVNRWTGVVWIIVMFLISCLDSHSDGTHSLQRIHWWASNGMLHFSKSVPLKKQTYLLLEWPEGEYIFIKFSWLCYCSFKCFCSVAYEVQKLPMYGLLTEEHTVLSWSMWNGM